MSPQHRRYATRAELVDLLDPYFRAAVAAMLDGLANHGVPVDALVKIHVDSQGKPVVIASAESVDLTERPEDTVRRFAEQLAYAQQLLLYGIQVTEDLRATPDPQAWESLRMWRERAAQFPLKPEDT